MTSRTYYLRLKNKGYVDTSIVSIRRVAMDELKSSDETTMDVYTSASMKVLVGSVMKMTEGDRSKIRKASDFIWECRSKGGITRTRILYDGTLLNKK